MTSVRIIVTTHDGETDVTVVTEEIRTAIGQVLRGGVGPTLDEAVARVRRAYEIAPTELGDAE